jgi:hypothetical protein
MILDRKRASMKTLTKQKFLLFKLHIHKTVLTNSNRINIKENVSCY